MQAQDIDAEMDGAIHPGRPGNQEAAVPPRPSQSHAAPDTSGMWLFLMEPSALLSRTQGGKELRDTLWVLK